VAEIQKRTETVVKNFYRLDLTEEEAQFLADVLSKVGGNVDLSRRRYERSIKGALEKADIKWNYAARDMRGTGIDFEDER